MPPLKPPPSALFICIAAFFRRKMQQNTIGLVKSGVALRRRSKMVISCDNGTVRLLLDSCLNFKITKFSLKKQKQSYMAHKMIPNYDNKSRSSGLMSQHLTLLHQHFFFSVQRGEITKEKFLLLLFIYFFLFMIGKKERGYS